MKQKQTLVSSLPRHITVIVAVCVPFLSPTQLSGSEDEVPVSLLPLGLSAHTGSIWHGAYSEKVSLLPDEDTESVTLCHL